MVKSTAEQRLDERVHLSHRIDHLIQDNASPETGPVGITNLVFRYARSLMQDIGDHRRRIEGLENRVSAISETRKAQDEYFATELSTLADRVENLLNRTTSPSASSVVPPNDPDPGSDHPVYSIKFTPEMLRPSDRSADSVFDAGRLRGVNSTPEIRSVNDWPDPRYDTFVVSLCRRYYELTPGPANAKTRKMMRKLYAHLTWSTEETTDYINDQMVSIAKRRFASGNPVDPLASRKDSK